MTDTRHSDQGVEARLDHTVRLLVNGVPRELIVGARLSLLDLLRERLQLTGTKKGCNQGACGALPIMPEDLL